MNGLVILSAFVLDRLVGDPRWLPHPIRGIGLLIERQEKLFRRWARSAFAETCAGVVLVMVTVSIVYFTAGVLALSAFRLSPAFGFIVSAVIAFTTIAARGLANAARSVLDKLEGGNIASARCELAMIVGRDTAQLDESE